MTVVGRKMQHTRHTWNRDIESFFLFPLKGTQCLQLQEQRLGREVKAKLGSAML